MVSAAIAMIRLFCKPATSHPNEPNNSLIVFISDKDGAFVRINGCRVSKAAGIKAKQAFFAPDISISPESGTPPSTRILSIVNYSFTRSLLILD